MRRCAPGESENFDSPAAPVFVDAVTLQGALHRCFVPTRAATSVALWCAYVHRAASLYEHQKRILKFHSLKPCQALSVQETPGFRGRA
jgi:hypothetical protein